MRAQLLTFRHQPVRFGRALQSVVRELFELCQFRIVGELSRGLFQKSESARVVTGMQTGIDLFHQPGFRFTAGLLLATFLQPLDFKLQSRILAVNRAQNFPIIERIAERTFLFVMVRSRNDGVHQIALVFDQPQGALEMSFVGMQIRAPL